MRRMYWIQLRLPSSKMRITSGQPWKIHSARLNLFFSTIKDLAAETFEKIGTTYDEHVAPMLATFRQGFTEIGTLWLNLYNAHILPVLQNLSTRFVEFKDQYLSPLIDKFLEFGGKVADAITKLWTGVLQPFIEWFMTNVAPVIASCLQTAIDTFFGFWEAVSGCHRRIAHSAWRCN